MVIKYELQITDSLATQIAKSIRDAILERRLKVDDGIFDVRGIWKIPLFF